MELSVFLIALVPLLLFGIGDAIAAIPARRLSPIAMTAVIDVCSFIGFGVVALFFWSQYQLDPAIWFSLIAGVAGYLGFIMFVYSLKTGSVGVTTAITNAYPMLTLAYAVFVLAEVITSWQFAAVAVILTGLFGVSTKFSLRVFSDPTINRASILLAFGAAVMWTLNVIFLNEALQTLTPLQSVHFSAIGSVLMSVVAFVATKQSLRSYSVARRNDLLALVAIAVLYFTGMFAFNVAMQAGAIGIVAAVAAASPFVSALAAYLFFQERLSSKEWLAITLIVVGLVLLGAF